MGSIINGERGYGDMRELCVWGDSISVQYRPHLADMLRGAYYVSVNPKEMEIAERNLDDPRGINTGDSFRVLEKLETYRREGLLTYDTLVINCGLHDIKRDRDTGAYQVPLSRYRENLGRVARILSGLPGKPFWVRTTPVEDERHRALSTFDRFGGDVERYNAAADEIMRAAGIDLIDLYTFTQNLDGERYTDHVHYTDRVRALQAAFIAGHILAGRPSARCSQILYIKSDE